MPTPIQLRLILNQLLCREPQLSVLVIGMHFIGSSCDEPQWCSGRGSQTWALGGGPVCACCLPLRTPPCDPGLPQGRLGTALRARHPGPCLSSLGLASHLAHPHLQLKLETSLTQKPFP
ncbi:hypothetical protein H1C71_018956, partial [Ictidomys tridecemlineatus]